MSNTLGKDHCKKYVDVIQIIVEKYLGMNRDEFERSLLRNEARAKEFLETNAIQSESGGDDK